MSKIKFFNSFQGLVIGSKINNSVYTLLTYHHGKIESYSPCFREMFPGLNTNFFISYECREKFILIEPTSINQKMNIYYPMTHYFINLICMYCIYPFASTKNIVSLFINFEENNNYLVQEFLSDILFIIFYEYDNALKKELLTLSTCRNLIIKFNYSLYSKHASLLEYIFTKEIMVEVL